MVELTPEAAMPHLVNFVRATNQYQKDHGGACPFCGPGEYPDPPDENHEKGCPMEPIQDKTRVISYDEAMAAMESTHEGERTATCPDCNQVITEFDHSCSEWEVNLTSTEFGRRELLCSKCNVPLGLIYGPKGIYTSGHQFCRRCAKLLKFERQHAKDTGCGEKHTWGDDDDNTCMNCGFSYDELVELSGWHDEGPSEV